MPHALRVYKSCCASGIDEHLSMAIANVVAMSRNQSEDLSRQAVVDILCEGGFEEEPAEAITDALSHCFLSERFKSTYAPNKLKVSLVRAKVSTSRANAILEAIEPCIVTGRNAEVRAPIKHPPSPGKVVMCDFSFLRKPEMQKERRAIVVSRKSGSPGRVTVVPVSKSETNGEHPHHYEFPPRRYPFFHDSQPVWAVCDHLYTVSLTRLWQVNVRRRPTIPSISDDDLESIRRMVGTALGVLPLTDHFSHEIEVAPAEGAFSAP